MQPNQILYFMNNNKPEFYAKSSDNFGTTAFKAFRFEEIDPDTFVYAESDQKNAAFENLNARISALEAKFQQFQEE